MMIIRLHHCLYCLPLLLAICQLPSHAEPLLAMQLRGSDALSPALQAATERYMALYPGASVVVVSGSNSLGIKGLLDGNADVALLQGALPSALVPTVARLGVPLKQRVLAYQALVPLVHADNPLTDISLMALRALFSGGINNWQQLGAWPGQVQVLAEPPIEGAAQAWQAAVLGPQGRYGLHTQLLPRAEMLQQACSRPQAIAFALAGPLPMGCKALSVAGVSATAGNIANGRYPLRLPLSLWWRTDATPEVGRLVQWLRAQQLRPTLGGGI